MKHMSIELAMSILLLVAVYITVCYGLPIAQASANNKKSASEGVSSTKSENSKTVVIDSGHGGIDGGKESKSGGLEKTINLSIAIKLKAILEADGINVIMTRTDDNGLYDENASNKKVSDMKKRCQIINNSKADLAVSIHQNSFPDSDVSGAQVFYYTYSAEGKKLAGILQNSFKENVNNNNTRVEKANKTYYMLVNTKIPIVIAECGFLSNPEEDALLNTEEYQQSIAEALYNGIVTYLIDE